jgi:hypothetical protein
MMAGGGGGSVSALFGYVPALGPEVPTLADNDASSHQPNHVAQESGHSEKFQGAVSSSVSRKVKGSRTETSFFLFLKKQ